MTQVMRYLLLAISILLLGPLLLLLVDSLFRGLFLIVAPRSLPPAPAPDNTWRRSFAAVIPAHDEEVRIGDTVTRLYRQLPPGSVFVIADNCSDATASVANKAGALVFERPAAPPLQETKGAALKWFVQQAGDRLDSYEVVGFFDADSIVENNFVAQAGAALTGDVDAVQGYVYAHTPPAWAADLAAYSEVLSQRIDDAGRNRLGWSVPMRGFGMVFRRDVLGDLLPQVRTRVEDVEMSLLSAGAGFSTRLAMNAVVGHQAETNRGVATQRARWQQGGRQVWRFHSRLILRLLLSGDPGKVSLVFATLVKPKTVMLLLKGLLFALFLLLPLHPAWLHWALAGAAGLALVLDLLYYLIGLCFVDEPRRYARVLLYAPIYLVMWLWSLALSFVSKKAWLSDRHDS